MKKSLKKAVAAIMSVAALTAFTPEASASPQALKFYITNSDAYWNRYTCDQVLKDIGILPLEKNFFPRYLFYKNWFNHRNWVVTQHMRANNMEGALTKKEIDSAVMYDFFRYRDKAWDCGHIVDLQDPMGTLSRVSDGLSSAAIVDFNKRIAK